jgi:hypothetical protein
VVAGRAATTRAWVGNADLLAHGHPWQAVGTAVPTGRIARLHRNPRIDHALEHRSIDDRKSIRVRAARVFGPAVEALTLDRRSTPNAILPVAGCARAECARPDG